MSDFETSDPAAGPPPLSRPTASEQLREVSFPLAVRGYERTAVDEFVRGVQALVEELERAQTREGAVQKALDDVGLETSSILRRAHGTADEITMRSRAEAHERLKQAENDSNRIRREADEYSEQIVVDTRLLWDERQRLIDDIRNLADEVLAVSDDALERVKMPEPLARMAGEPEPAPAAGPIAGGVEPAPPEPAPAGATSPEAGAEALEGDTGELEPVEPSADTGEYEPVEATEPYEFDDGSLEAETPPYRFGRRREERAAPPPAEDESDHTVELEALPGGADDQQGREPAHGWDRER